MIFSSPKDSQQIAKLIKKGAIGVFPTDTVYAIGCSAFDEKAIKKIFQIKKRPVNKSLQVHIHDLSQLKMFVDYIPECATKIIDKYWPGPITIVFKSKKELYLKYITTSNQTIAIRFPDCDAEKIIMKQANHPLVAPSANTSGKKPALNINEAFSYFGEKVDFYYDAGPAKTREVSTIIDATKENLKIIRQGSISLF